MRNIVNVINFVRGCEPRNPGMDLVTPLYEEFELCKKYNYSSTVLMQYDALIRDDLVSIVKDNLNGNTEVGLWFEMNKCLTEKLGIAWRGRPGYDWDWYVNPGFLPAYTNIQKEAIIDEVVAKFIQVFGFKPKSAGSWLLDAHSMKYMSEKYGFDAFCICREQYGVDAYTLKGGYFNQGYYPSVHNALCPAQTDECEIHTPVFRMLTPDPIYNYGKAGLKQGCPTLEPVWYSGHTEAVVDWYYDKYFNNPSLAFSYAHIGQENSFGWDKIKKGLPMQMEKLYDYVKDGKVVVETLGDTGRWFKKTFAKTPATALAADDSWSSDNYKSVWYDCINYRANLFMDEKRLLFRDIYKFDENYRERYIDSPCVENDAVYDTLPVIDGYLWKGGLYFENEGFERFEVSETGGNLLVRTDDGASVLFSEEKIVVKNAGKLIFDAEPNSETSFGIVGNTLRFIHNSFEYAVEIKGELVPNGAKYEIAGDTIEILMK